MFRSVRTVKGLFGSLLCLVLATSQAFALKGGPQYPGASNVAGTYAGVLQGLLDPTDPRSSNSIGIFSVGVPQTGLSSGAFVMFAQGRVFSGTIRGVGQPSGSSFKAILNATYDYTLTFTVPGPSGSVTLQTTDVTATVNGNLNARVQAPRAATAPLTATLLRGDATLYIDQGGVANNGEPVITGVLLMTVNGFKQSNTAPTGSSVPAG